MSTLSTEELREQAREVFGRELSDAQLETYRGRLPTMVRNVRTVRGQQCSLDAIEPALVLQVPAGDGHG